jgi:membrane-associated phospholipid phosphatase
MKNHPWKNLNAIDKITFLYIWGTAILIFFSWNELDNKLLPLGVRIGCTLLIYSMIRFQSLLHGRILGFLRIAYPLILIIYFYPETDQFNNILFEDQDSFFYRIEESLFGSQPALLFLKNYPQPWVIELMSFGYFSYYLIIFSFCLILYLKDPDVFYRLTFILTSSFFIYYCIFIILPVAGPQYYFPPPENEVPKAYFFSGMLKLIQELGERPTGAFPSSHVGIVILILFYSYRQARTYFYIVIPISILLILSTVYLKAHYVIDVLAAFITLPLIFIASKYFYLLFEKNYQNP